MIMRRNSFLHSAVKTTTRQHMVQPAHGEASTYEYSTPHDASQANPSHHPKRKLSSLVIIRLALCTMHTLHTYEHPLTAGEPSVEKTRYFQLSSFCSI